MVPHSLPNSTMSLILPHNSSTLTQHTDEHVPNNPDTLYHNPSSNDETIVPSREFDVPIDIPMDTEPRSISPVPNGEINPHFRYNLISFSHPPGEFLYQQFISRCVLIPKIKSSIANEPTTKPNDLFENSSDISDIPEQQSGDDRAFAPPLPPLKNEEQKRKRGRPPGSKNKSTLFALPFLEPKIKHEPKHGSEDQEKTERRLSITIKEEGVLLPGRKKTLPYSSIHNTDRSGRTFLFKFAKMGDFDSCKALLEAGANINSKDNAGWTPLHEACIEGHFDIVRLLLQYGADPNSSAIDQDTPLHDSAQNGHKEIVQILLSYGAHLNTLNKQGQSAENVAETPEIRRLINEWNEWTQKLSVRNELGQNSLHLASINGDCEEIIELLNYGADLDVQDNASWTPLHEAANIGHAKVIELLLLHGANKNIQSQNGYTPLMVACEKQHIDCVKILLEFGCDQIIPNMNQKTAKDLAQDNKLITELLDRFVGIEPTRQSKFECIPIGEINAARILVNKPFINHPHPTVEINGPNEYNKMESDSRKTSMETDETDSTSTQQAYSNSLNTPTSKTLSREERKFQALLRTIQSLEGGQNAPTPFYYIPKFVDIEGTNKKKKPSLSGVYDFSTPAKRKRGRPRKTHDEESRKISFSKMDKYDYSDSEPEYTPNEKKVSLPNPTLSNSNTNTMNMNESYLQETKPEIKFSPIKKSPETIKIVPSIKEEPKQSKGIQQINKPETKPITKTISEDNKKRYKKEEPKPLLVVSKRIKKKNWLGISGYKDLENDNHNKEINIPNTPKETPGIQLEFEDTLFLIKVKESIFVIDLQIALAFGYTSGRAFTDKYTTIDKRVATIQEKAFLESSKVSEHILQTMYKKNGDGTEESCRWIKPIITSSGAKGLRLSDIDIQFLDLESLKRIIRNWNDIIVEEIRLDVGIGFNVLESPVSNVTGFVSKFKKLRP